MLELICYLSKAAAGLRLLLGAMVQIGLAERNPTDVLVSWRMSGYATLG